MVMRNSKHDFSNVVALVVEDSADGMAIIGVLMRYLGIDAFIDSSGDNAISIALSMNPRPNIVFLDLNLPRTNGYEILKKIRANNDLKDVTVIAVTAQDADSEIPKCREAGFDGYIGKPISRMRFPRQLRRILNGESVWETY